MYDYDLDGKQVILVIDKNTIEELKPLGIPGSPVYGRVFKAVDRGIWLENHAFPVCPVDQPKILKPNGEALCHAHVFIPADAIVSMAVFPSAVEELAEHPGLHHIGFQPEKV